MGDFVSASKIRVAAVSFADTATVLFDLNEPLPIPALQRAVWTGGIDDRFSETNTHLGLHEVRETLLQAAAGFREYEYPVRVVVLSGTTRCPLVLPKSALGPP